MRNKSDVFSMARGLMFDLNLTLFPYLMFAIREGSSESRLMFRLI